MKKPRPSRATGRKKGGSKPHGAAPLTEQVRLRLTAADYERVAELAEAAQVSPAEWARGRVEEALRRADHARMTVAHLDAMGGMPSATP
jgi:hypothetical protein